MRLILHLAGGKIGGFQDRQILDILLPGRVRIVVAHQQFRRGGNFLTGGGHRLRPPLLRPVHDGIILADQFIPAKYFLHVLYGFRGQAYRVTTFRVAVPRLRPRPVRVIARVDQLLLLVLGQNIEIVRLSTRHEREVTRLLVPKGLVTLQLPFERFRDGISVEQGHQTVLFQHVLQLQTAYRRLRFQIELGIVPLQIWGRHR